MNENVEFFWNGPFSQWHPSNFIYRDINFNTAEQFMMYQKATIMGDTLTAMEILEEPHPRFQKELGKKVTNFDPVLWDRVKQHVVYTGNYLKFTQNENLLKNLLDTGNKTIVEASPYDTIWGIGMGEEEAQNTDPSNWKGQNLLGVALMEVRKDLRNLKK